MMDNQIQQYLLVSRNWQKPDQEPLQGWQDLPNRPRIYVRLVQLLGRVMVKIGQSLQRTAEPSYQTARQTN